MTIEQIIQTAVNNGIGLACAVVVLWFAYYRETKTIPQMLQTFSDVQQSATLAFENRNNKLIETFTAVTREERENYQVWHEENRSRLDVIVAEIKENRYYSKDMAQQLRIDKVLEDERNKRSKRKEEESHPS